MIAMIHTCPWLVTGTPLVFPAGTESFFDHPILTTAARFTGDPIDYVGPRAASSTKPSQPDLPRRPRTCQIF